MKSRLNEHGSVLRTKVSGIGPSRVLVNGGEGFAYSWLNPPFSTPGVQNELELRIAADYAALNDVERVRAAFGCRWNSGELNARARGFLLEMTASERGQTEEENQIRWSRTAKEAADGGSQAKCMESKTTISSALGSEAGQLETSALRSSVSKIVDEFSPRRADGPKD